MLTPRVFVDCELHPDAELTLPSDSAHYLINVLRRKTGDELVLFNGNGYEYPAKLIQISKKSAQVTTRSEVTDCSWRESPLKIHAGIALTKGQRMDYAVQKLTEMGVTEITPLTSDYSIVKLDQKRQQSKLEHWQGVMRSAAEQSGRCMMPLIHPVEPMEQWADSLDPSITRLVFDPDVDGTLKQIPKTDRIAIAIGPEGGLSPAEVSALQSKGFQAVRLGHRILRAETAPVAATTALQILFGDFLGSEKR